MANNTDALLTPSMPHSPQAEQAVLGSMLIDADCVKDVMDKLQAQDFYLRTNREIFETIYHMFVYSQPIDGVTVAGELEKNGLYNDNTRSYLLQLMEVTPTSANVMEYVRIVQDKSLMRQVAQAAGSITAMVQEGTGTAQEVLEAAEQKIYAIRRGRSAQSMATIQVVLQEVMEHLAELSAQGGKTLPGLSTGFSAGCSGCGSTGSGVSTVSCVPEVAAVSCAPVLSSALGAASSAETPEPSSSALFSNSVSTLNRSSRSGSALSALPQPRCG